ncbi:MAG: c-type cytochrome biogenesis protein CcmI [Burkholderiaceae bacterium]
MTVFWLLVSTLIVAGLAALLLPMFRRPAAVDDEREARLAVYRDRRREIERERAAGRLGADEARAAIDELAGEVRVFLPDPSSPVAPSAGQPVRARSGHRALAATLAVAVPALAVLLYLHLGSPGLIGIDPQAARGPATEAEIAQALDALQRRVREQPDDAQAWTMLARARRIRGDLPGSMQAFAEATRLQPQDARLLAEFAEAVAASRDGDFGGQPEQLLEQALQLSPDEPKALALMGAAQYRLGHREQALTYLRRLLSGMDPRSEQTRQIEAVAQRIAGEIGAGGQGATGQGDPGQGSTGQGSTGQVSAGQGSNGQGLNGQAAGAAAPSTAAPPSSAPSASASTGVAGRITIADALRAQVPPGATLFVSARLVDGPRMPLAALRQPVTGWPLDYALTDAQAMTPEHRISQAARVIVEARISRQGTAMRQAGDLIGSSGPVAPGGRPVDIRIEQVVP